MSEDDSEVPVDPNERPILRTGIRTGGDELGKKALAVGAVVLAGSTVVNKGCDVVKGINEGGIGNYFQQAHELAVDGNEAGRKFKMSEIEPFDPLKEKDKRDRER